MCKAESGVTSRSEVGSVRGSGSCLEVCLKPVQIADRLLSAADVMATC